MSAAPGPVSIPWVRASEVMQIVTVASLPEHWVSHWAPELARAVKCLGDRCEWCDRGIEAQLRVVVGVLDARKGRMLFEFRERHRPVFEALYDLGPECLGCRLRIWKSGPAKNSPVQVELLDQRTSGVSPWDIQALVNSLGASARPSPRQSHSDLGEAEQRVREGDQSQRLRIA